MRKLLVLAMAVAAVLLAIVPITAASAATPDVLTTGKVGGTNVKVHAVLKASLESGTKATFFTSGTKGVTCGNSTFTEVVTKNPAKPGTAVESLTAQTFSGCKVAGILGVTGVKSVVLDKLPYKTTVSDSEGNPVTLVGTRAIITLKTVIGTLSCTYSATNTTGHASNKGQVISFSKQPFKLSSGPATCPKNGTFSEAFGPVKDTSVQGSPPVFVN